MRRGRSGGRIPALEGLRGVAAAVVVARHSFNAVSQPENLRAALLEGPTACLFNAQGAVQLFFVLSGFVLAGSLSRAPQRLDTLQFWVKRVFRIHPPYVLAVLVAWGLSFFYGVPAEEAGFTSWIRLQAAVHIGSDELLRSFLFPGTASGQLPVGWTLEVEMIFSLLLPLLFLIARRIHWGALLALGTVPLIWPRMGYPGLPPQLAFGVDFCIGIALYLEREALTRWVSMLRPGAGAVALVACLLLFASPAILAGHRGNLDILVPGFANDPLAIAAMGVGSAGLIVLAMAQPAWQSFLTTRPVLWLGRVSFSLYLLHFPVLLLCTRFFEPRGLPGWLALFAVVMTGAGLLSEAFHRAVELPSILAGNRVCAALVGSGRGKALETTLPG